MNVLIFGATGSIGKHLVAQSLTEGHTVSAFVRAPSKVDTPHPNLRIIQGNVLDAESVKAAMSDQETVLVALGAGRHGEVRSEGTRNIIDAMKASNVRRLICQTTLGAGDSSTHLNLKWRFIFGVLLRKAFADHQLQETYIQQSDLDWTIVRPAAFTDGDQTGRYQHGFGQLAKGLTLSISRADVADFMLKQLSNRDYLHMTPGLSY